MPRIQILQLPEGPNDERPPFVLVVDQCHFDTADAYDIVNSSWQQLGSQIGARGCIVTTDTIDIPANDHTAYLHGFREQVEAAAAEAQRKLKPRCCETAFLTLGRDHSPDCTGPGQS